MYWCEQDYSGSHPVLGGLIHQGECDLTMISNPEQLAAIHALVEAGVLRDRCAHGADVMTHIYLLVTGMYEGYTVLGVYTDDDHRSAGG